MIGALGVPRDDATRSTLPLDDVIHLHSRQLHNTLGTPRHSKKGVIGRDPKGFQKGNHRDPRDP